MRFALSIALGFGLLTTSVHAADEAEKLITEIIKAFDDLEGQLKKIENAETATKALPEIKKMILKVDDLRAKSDKLKIDPKDEDALLKKYQEKLFEAGSKIGKQVSRVSSMEGTKEAVEIVLKMAEKMGLPLEKTPEKKK